LNLLEGIVVNELGELQSCVFDPGGYECWVSFVELLLRGDAGSFQKS